MCSSDLDVVDLRHRVVAHVAAPGQALLGIDDRDLRGRPRLALDDLHPFAVSQSQVVGQRRRIGDGGRQADEARPRRQRRQSRQAQRQMMAALGRGEGMQLVDHDAAQAGEELLGVGVAEQQRQRFRRGHQQVRRALALAQAPALRRVPGPAFRPHRQLHLGNRQFEIAANIGRQGLERRDVDRMQFALALGVSQVIAGPTPLGELDQGGQEACQGFAAAGRRDQQGTPATFCQFDQRKLVAARSPAPACEPA